MEKAKSVTFAFTARRIEMALELVSGAIHHMQAKAVATSDPLEAAFYERQTPAFETLAGILTKTQLAAGKKGATRKVRLTEQQFQMLTGSIGQRNLVEVRALYDMPDGPEKDKRIAAHDEWAQFHEALEAKDPRKYDTSQDAEDEEEDEDAESDE